MNENYPDYPNRREYREERRQARQDRRDGFFPPDDYSGQPSFNQPGFSTNAFTDQNYPAPEYFQSQARFRQSWLDRQRKFLYTNAVSFLLLSALLILVWFVSRSGYFWPIWVIVPWAIGLVNQALYVWLGQRNR